MEWWSKVVRRQHDSGIAVPGAGEPGKTMGARVQMSSPRKRGSSPSGALLARLDTRFARLMAAVGSCLVCCCRRRLMRVQETAHVTDCLLDLLLGLFPRIEADFGFRREAHRLHRHRIGMRRNIIW